MKHAAGAAAARAVIRSCSAPSSVMYARPALVFTAVPAVRATGRQLSRRYGAHPRSVAPERLYLETRWASLVPYAAAAELLSDVLPIGAGANATTVRQHVLRVAERAEAELRRRETLLYRWVSGGLAGVAGPGGPYRGRPRRRLRSRLGRAKAQLRDHRRPLHAGGPPSALPRPRAWVRPQTEAPPCRRLDQPGTAGEPGHHVPDGRRRGGARAHGADQPVRRTRS